MSDQDKFSGSYVLVIGRCPKCGAGVSKSERRSDVTDIYFDCGAQWSNGHYIEGRLVAREYRYIPSVICFEFQLATVTAERNYLEQNETAIWEVLGLPDGSTVYDVIAAIRKLKQGT